MTWHRPVGLRAGLTLLNEDIGEMSFDPTQPSMRDVIVGENNFMLVALSSYG